jgi:hypothetical protein
MTNSYSISRCTWIWAKNLFFYLLDVSILNSYILVTFCGSKLTHRDFRLALVRDLIQEGGGCLNHRPSYVADQLFPLSNRQDLTFGTVNTGPQMEDEFTATCVLQNINKCRHKFSCPKCSVGLCVDPCFRVYHTQ